MTDYGKMRGSVKPQDIEITANAVFIASDITPFKEKIDDYVYEGYEYLYKSYTKDEYLLKLAQENAELRQTVLDTQMALVELYEGSDEV